MENLCLSEFGANRDTVLNLREELCDCRPSKIVASFVYFFNCHSGHEYPTIEPFPRAIRHPDGGSVALPLRLRPVQLSVRTALGGDRRNRLPLRLLSPYSRYEHGNALTIGCIYLTVECHQVTFLQLYRDQDIRCGSHGKE